MSRPIPEIKPVNGWKALPIKECGEPLVPLGPFSKYPSVFGDGIYYGECASSPYERGELSGALVTHFVRKGVAERLEQASASLAPFRMALMVLDCYRPMSVQQALYDDFHHQLIKKKGMSSEKASIEAQRFVSIPSNDSTKPPPHNTGGSVDLTIVKFTEAAWSELCDLNLRLKSKDWKVVYSAEMRRLRLVRESDCLEMGGRFDEVGPATATRYFEEKSAAGTLDLTERHALFNRRLLYNTLHSVGLSPYGEEWWHFDYGNQFDAIRTGRQAIYGAANFSKDCMAHEERRRNFLKENELYASDAHAVPATKLGFADDEVTAVVRQEALKFGDFRRTRHPKGDRLMVA